MKNEINEEYVAELLIKDAIENIKDRNIKREKGCSYYNVANWRDDWDWIMDDESNFQSTCTIAGYNADKIRNETMRLAGTRVEDGIKSSTEWFVAGIKPNR